MISVTKHAMSSIVSNKAAEKLSTLREKQIDTAMDKDEQSEFKVSTLSDRRLTTDGPAQEEALEQVNVLEPKTKE